MADKVDYAWDALLHYGARVEEYGDTAPELDEDEDQGEGYWLYMPDDNEYVNAEEL